MTRLAVLLSLSATILLALPAPIIAQATRASRPSWADALDAVVRADMKRARVLGASIAVVSNGRLAYMQAYGIANSETLQPMSSAMLLRTGSLTKMFTGLLAAELHERGVLALDAPVGSIVKELNGKRIGTVTLHQLLSHSAGVINNAVAYGRMGEGALGEVMREVSDTMLNAEPGARYAYSNPGYSLAGYVTEVAGRKRFATLMDSLVLRPLQMTRSTFRPLEALTWPWAQGHTRNDAGLAEVVRPMTENTAQWPAGFLFSSAPDLARMTIALMDSGRIDGVQRVAARAVARMTTGHVAHPGLPASLGVDSARYGYGLVVGSRGTDRVWLHGGTINGYESLLIMLPDRKAAVIMLLNTAGGELADTPDAALRYATGSASPKKAATPSRRR